MSSKKNIDKKTEEACNEAIETAKSCRGECGGRIPQTVYKYEITSDGTPAGTYIKINGNIIAGAQYFKMHADINKPLVEVVIGGPVNIIPTVREA